MVVGLSFNYLIIVNDKVRLCGVQYVYYLMYGMHRVNSEHKYSCMHFTLDNNIMSSNGSGRNGNVHNSLEWIAIIQKFNWILQRKMQWRQITSKLESGEGDRESNQTFNNKVYVVWVNSQKYDKYV